MSNPMNPEPRSERRLIWVLQIFATAIILLINCTNPTGDDPRSLDKPTTQDGVRYQGGNTSQKPGCDHEKGVLGRCLTSACIYYDGGN